MTKATKETFDYIDQSNRHKETIEMHYLRKKTYYVNGILVFLMLPIILALYNYEIAVLNIAIYIMFLSIILSINVLFLQAPKYFSNLKLSMYITSIALPLFSLSLIMDVQSPSVFTIMFLVYAIISIYQDRQATFINNTALFIIGTYVIFRYPEMFQMVEGQTTRTIYIYVFMLIFVALLSIASYVLIQRKVFYYNQVAKIKETEIRIINILVDLKQQYSQTKFDFNEYYDQLKEFSKEVTKKIDIENIFQARIDLLKELNEDTIAKITKDHTHVKLRELEELKRLELDVHTKMHYLLVKASQIKNIDYSKNDIYNENHFPSFKHTFDNKYTKIIAFAVFYVMLKVDKPYLETLDGKTIRKLLKQDDFYHLIDPQIADIYFSHSKVIDKLVTEALNKKVTT